MIYDWLGLEDGPPYLWLITAATGGYTENDNINVTEPAEMTLIYDWTGVEDGRPSPWLIAAAIGGYTKIIITHLHCY